MTALRSALRSAIRPAVRSAITLNTGGGVDPITALFADGNNRRGFAFAPWRLDTLYLERTGASATTPAVVDGAVGTIADISGHGLYAVALSDAKRAVLRHSNGLYWLEHDGADDSYQISALTLGATQYEWIALDQTPGKTFFTEHSANVGTNNGHYFWGSSGQAWAMRRGGVTQSVAGVSAWANGLHVNERQYIASSGGVYRRDGTDLANGTVTGSALAESDVTDAYNIQSRNQSSIFFQGKAFGHVLADGPAPSPALILSIRQLLASKSGVSL